MVKAAICDANQRFCADLENMILIYGKENNCEIEVNIFFSAKNLYGFLQKNAVDLLFLSIEPQKTNGIKIGMYIRDHLLNDTIEIIYISSDKKYALPSFESRPFDFLMKPVSYAKIAHTLQKALRFINKDTLFFNYKFRHDFIKLPFRDILYFESNNKKIYPIAAKEVPSYYGKLDEITTPDNEFLRIHQSYLINIHHVSRFYYNRVIMDNHDEISISIPYRKTAREVLTELWQS